MIQKIKIFQVDAFTDTLFKGNPAAVCVLDKWLDDGLMQSIGAENNLAETAFIVPTGDKFGIRWFTPSVEVDLCGHATLASAYVIFNHLGYVGDEIIFNSPRSGILKVKRTSELLSLDFPADIIKPISQNQIIIDGIGVKPSELLKGKTDYIAVLDSEQEVINVIPKFDVISKLDGRGLIVTAPGTDCDFVSRFFGPQSGIDEDPVTGSAHTSLTPYWAKRLNKKILKAKQLSKRGGVLYCIDNGDRTVISGNAKLFLIGEIYIKLN